MATKVSKQPSREDRLAKLREKIASTDMSSGFAGFWSPDEGKSIVRILPEVKDMQFFFQVVGRHEMPGGKRGSAIYCPRITTEGELPCPICELVDQLRGGDAASKDLAESMKVKRSFWMNVIVRGKEKFGPQIYTPGIMVFGDVSSLISDPDYGDITDPYDGLDITIERTGKGKETEYSVHPRRNSTPLAADGAEADQAQIDEWLSKAANLGVTLLTDDPEEDRGLIGDRKLYILPYERIVRENNLDADEDAATAEKVDEEPEEEEPVRRPIKTAGKVTTTKTTAKRQPVVEEDDEDEEEEPEVKQEVERRLARRRVR